MEKVGTHFFQVWESLHNLYCDDCLEALSDHYDNFNGVEVYTVEDSTTGQLLGFLCPVCAKEGVGLHV